MSPYNVNSNGNAHVFVVKDDGFGGRVYFTNGVRPVINLKADVTISSGDGTSTNPYVI